MFVFSTASIFNLILLSLDRYWAVVYPLLYLQNRSRKRAISFILTVWFISSLWAPAIIFWPSISPNNSDILKPTECDTAFRSNKLFKTLTALVNFYIPLFAMIVISCRIMVAIRSRSTMEFGRRISSTTRKQMKQYQTFIHASIKRQNADERTSAKPLSSDDIDGRVTSPTVTINRIESTMENTEHPSIQSDDNTELTISNHVNNSDQYKSNRKTSFHFSNIKRIKTLFPSLVTLKDSDKRKSEDLTRRYSVHPKMTNSLSVSHNMKYAERLFKSSDILRASSPDSSSSDEGSQNADASPLEQQTYKSLEKLPM